MLKKLGDINIRAWYLPVIILAQRGSDCPSRYSLGVIFIICLQAREKAKKF